MKRKLLQAVVILTFLISAISCTEKKTVNIDVKGIIPVPTSITEADGSFQIDEESTITIQSEELRAVAGFYADHLGVNKIEASADKNSGNIVLSIDSSKSAESYDLQVSPDAITVVGGDEAGVFYALHTLRQIKTDNGIPSVSIQDAPRFGYRGTMLDVARHFFSVEDVKSFLDLMAFHKLNKFHWHLTEDQGWRIEINKYPLLTEIGSQRKETVIGHARDSKEYDGTPYGGFYTQEEIKEVIKYAAERYIEVIPEIEMPGHSSAALAAYPELGCKEGPFEVGTTWGVSENLFCPTEYTFGFLQDVLTEVIALFPSQYVHIGADEAVKPQWEASEFCQNLIDSLDLEDEHGLQSYFVKRIETFLNSKGKKLIGWDEILEGGLSPNATVMSWRGVKGGIEAARQKHDVIMTPTTHLYFDYYQDSLDAAEKKPFAIGGLLPLDKVYSYEPLPEELTTEEQKYILGAQANIWTEYMKTFSHVQYMALPRMAALSEIVWSKAEQKDWTDFQNRLQDMFTCYDEQGLNYGKHYLKQ
ncbi:MAG: beta-N-acetylhexosaminidase [Cyclobacteriaceae bacterium]